MPRKSLNLRPETTRKWDYIRKQRRWTLTETADALADEYLERDGIDPMTFLKDENNAAEAANPAA